MEIIASALHPIPALVWGERAFAALGVRLVCKNYLLVIEDDAFDAAVQRLRSSNFRDWSWSYGCAVPNSYQSGLTQNIYRSVVNGYRYLDQNSARFLFPVEQQSTSSTAKVVLLPSSYAHLHLKSMSQNIARRDDNIIYPDGAALLQSFVQTIVREPTPGKWTSKLDMWSITYVYGELMLADDVLDLCDDEKAKDWFNDAIQRFGNGIDRVTCTKRLGRVGYDERLARIP
ncbi:hypothetical protein QQS21_010844 [Conoideocrella luteorostrata]|uniref:Uncharacterized protein n=1 Tax=Conoideocrella luteorostrata TaxID=1105319 RepID=A0AAJ0CGJ8_9HYPO|nr:hypothetical protein QQS21_010844 [Conoideocrella luteorostrata]